MHDVLVAAAGQAVCIQQQCSAWTEHSPGHGVAARQSCRTILLTVACWKQSSEVHLQSAVPVMQFVIAVAWQVADYHATSQFGSCMIRKCCNDFSTGDSVCEQSLPT